MVRVRDIIRGQGYIDAEFFCNVVEFDLLPLMTSFPNPNSVLLLDNAPVHMKAKLVNILARIGALVIFLSMFIS